jgi:broad specificity phosphatase PhoE
LPGSVNCGIAVQLCTHFPLVLGEAGFSLLSTALMATGAATTAVNAAATNRLAIDLRCLNECMGDRTSSVTFNDGNVSKYLPKSGAAQASSGTVGRVILVRHAMPRIDPSIDAERWHLGEAGRAAARALRPLIPQPAYYVASPEPKAAQTVLELAGDADVATDAGFAEVRRPHVWSAEADYRALARAYVEGAGHAGWEPHGEVAARFEQAVARHLAAAGPAVLVIGTHGLAPTVWLASRFTLEPSPGAFWAALEFPDLIDVDPVTGSVQRYGQPT